MTCFRSVFGHLKIVLTHKYWVFRYAAAAGIPVRGLLHDLSKFSPAEWTESVRYYSGVRSPIRDARAQNQFSAVWLHHRGRNRHHFEYWVDNTADGALITVPMPFLCALELICDRLGAARAYLKENFTVAEQLTRLDKDIDPSPLIHPQTKLFIRKMFEALNAAPNQKEFNKILRSARLYYEEAQKEAERNSLPESSVIVRSVTPPVNSEHGQP